MHTCSLHYTLHYPGSEPHIPRLVCHAAFIRVLRTTGMTSGTIVHRVHMHGVRMHGPRAGVTIMMHTGVPSVGAGATAVGSRCAGAWCHSK